MIRRAATHIISKRENSSTREVSYILCRCTNQTFGHPVATLSCCRNPDDPLSAVDELGLYNYSVHVWHTGGRYPSLDFPPGD